MNFNVSGLKSMLVPILLVAIPLLVAGGIYIASPWGDSPRQGPER